MKLSISSKRVNLFGTDCKITKITEICPNIFALQCEANLLDSYGKSIGTIQIEIPQVSKNGVIIGAGNKIIGESKCNI